MRRVTRCAVSLAATATAVSAGLAVAPAALAGQSFDSINCDGHELTIRVNQSNSSDNGGWSVAQVYDGGSGHLIPTSFSGTAYDETADLTIFEFESAKGKGNAHRNQDTVACTVSETGTLGDLLEPGETPPPGTSLSDVVTFTFTATAVWKR